MVARQLPLTWMECYRIVFHQVLLTSLIITNQYRFNATYLTFTSVSLRSPGIVFDFKTLKLTEKEFKELRFNKFWNRVQRKCFLIFLGSVQVRLQCENFSFHSVFATTWSFSARLKGQVRQWTNGSAERPLIKSNHKYTLFCNIQ